MTSQNPTDFFAHRRARAGIPDRRPDERTPCGIVIPGARLDALRVPRTEQVLVTCFNPLCIPCRAADARLEQRAGAGMLVPLLDQQRDGAERLPRDPPL